MQIVLDASDLRRLSPFARSELLRLFQADGAASVPTRVVNKKGFRWRVPYDLTPELARKLMRGVGQDARKRLQLFARDGGRATMRELLAVTRDADLHVLSAFEGALTRKLRRLVGDDEKIVSLIMWDYDAEKWDPEHKTLLDGVYYVSPATVQAFRQVFER